MTILLGILGLFILAVIVGSIVHCLRERKKKRHIQEFKAELDKSKLPMSEAAFLANWGRPLNALEEDLAGRARQVFGRVTSLGPDLIYPRDQALSLFGRSRLTTADALQRLLKDQDFDLMIREYAVNLRQVKNFQKRPLAVAEFIDSLIEASDFSVKIDPSAPDEAGRQDFAENFNIRPEHLARAEAILRVLENGLDLEAGSLKLVTKTAELDKKALEKFKSLSMDVGGILGLDQYGGRTSTPPGPDSSWPSQPGQLIFPCLGDWIYWLIYHFTGRQGSVSMPQSGQCAAEAAPPVCPPKGSIVSEPSSNYTELLRWAADFNIQPRHLPIAICVRRALSELMGYGYRRLNLDLTLDELYAREPEYIDPVEFTISLEELLGVGIGDDINYWHYLDFSRPQDGSPRFFHRFGDWLHWYIYTCLRESTIHVHLGSERYGVEISGRSYLAGWDLGFGPFGPGWSRLNDPPES